MIAGYLLFLALDLFLEDDHGRGDAKHPFHENGTISYPDDVQEAAAAADNLIDGSDIDVSISSLNSLPISEYTGKSVVIDDGDSTVYVVTSYKSGWVSISLPSKPFTPVCKKRAKNLLLITAAAVPPPFSSSDAPNSSLSSTALLSILGDVLHNVTDGVAIAASASTSDPLTLKSLLTPISIMLHEVPHELGDYAVLLSCGYSKSSAILTQFYTAGGAFFGCWAALQFVSYFEASPYIALLSPFCSGGFIYLSSCLINEVVKEKR